MVVVCSFLVVDVVGLGFVRRVIGGAFVIFGIRSDLAGIIWDDGGMVSFVAAEPSGWGWVHAV